MFLKFMIYLPAKTTQEHRAPKQLGALKLIYVKAVQIGFAKRRAEKPFRRKGSIIALRLWEALSLRCIKIYSVITLPESKEFPGRSQAALL